MATRVARSTGRTCVTPVATHLQAAGDEIVEPHLYADTLAVADAYAQ